MWGWMDYCGEEAFSKKTLIQTHFLAIKNSQLQKFHQKKTKKTECFNLQNDSFPLI